MSGQKLQTPKYAMRNGELIAWQDAVLHVGCEAVNRGLSVFEGLKGYWLDDGEFALLDARKHYERLLRSARLLHIPCTCSFDEFETAAISLARELLVPDNDLWIRATLFVVEGHWGENTRADLIMTAYQSDKSIPSSIKVGISTWQRSSDAALSYRIKSAANYQVGRLARIEGRPRNCDEMILLNQWGRVAEATGSAVIMVRNGAVVTPCSTEGALESITVDIAEAIAHSLTLDFSRRPIDRTELLVADEICICGTLNEFVPVAEVDGHKFESAGPVLSAVRERFYDAVRGRCEQPGVTLSRMGN